MRILLIGSADVVGTRCQTRSSMNKVNVDSDLDLWQQEALAAWRQHGRLGVVQAVTGAGRQGSVSQRSRSVAATQARCHRGSHAGARRAVGSGRAGVVDGFHMATTVSPRRDDWKVLIGTVHTLAKAYPCAPDESAQLIDDECHRYGASEFSRALDDRFRHGKPGSASRGRPASLHAARRRPRDRPSTSQRTVLLAMVESSPSTRAARVN